MNPLFRTARSAGERAAQAGAPKKNNPYREDADGEYMTQRMCAKEWDAGWEAEMAASFTDLIDGQQTVADLRLAFEFGA